MGRPQKEIYCFLSNASNLFYYTQRDLYGNPVVKTQGTPIPLSYQPLNLNNSKVEFATNKQYFSLVRSLMYPLKFIKDGADIIRERYYLGAGIEEKTYLTIIKWDGTVGYFKLAYKALIDYSKIVDDPNQGIEVNLLDDSAWALIENNDSVQYQIDCSPTNSKAIPVLLDGTNLKARYTFQPVATKVFCVEGGQFQTVPFVLVNTDGDATGVIVKSQNCVPITLTGDTFSDINNLNNFLQDLYGGDVNIQGTITFIPDTNTSPLGGLKMYFVTNKQTFFHPDQRTYIFNDPFGASITPGQKVTVKFNLNFSLTDGENIFFIVEINDNPSRGMSVKYQVSNVFVSLTSRNEATICYALRPLDLWKELVARATNNRYGINSNLYTVENKRVITSGDAIRQIPNATISSSIQDMFKSFNSLDFIAFRCINGSLFVEKAVDVYSNAAGLIIDLGEVIKLTITPAIDYFVNEIVIGSPKQDYRHPSGRLEFNTEDKYSVPITNVKKQLNLVSKFRTDSYGVNFIQLDYQADSTTDNSGDSEAFILDITDNTATAITEVPNFVDVNFDEAPLAPILLSPLNAETLSYNRPIIRGKAAPVGATVNVYVDGVLDGSTTVNTDFTWNYQIVTPLSNFVVGVDTGEHVIEVTFTDLGGSISTINVTINTDNPTALLFVNPTNNSVIYNNKPKVFGVAQQGTVILFKVDGVTIGTVTADTSNKWSIQLPVLSFGNHILDANGNTETITVVSVPIPLITNYVENEVEVNQRPTIIGVAPAGSAVNLYLNYDSTTLIGTTVADANGNWSITPTVDIPNGLNNLSTSLVIDHVGIGILGYELNRPAYTSITGVLDNTVFNTLISPKWMLRSWYPYLSSITQQQKNKLITFEGSDKNANLRTVLSGVTTAERDAVSTSSLGSPLFGANVIKFTASANSTFNDTFYDFSNGGIISLLHNNTRIFCLPIGKMSQASVTSEEQEWELLQAPDTLMQTLLKLSRTTTYIQVMNSAFTHAIYNSLHIVEYDFQQPNNIDYATIYQKWFEERNTRWANKVTYIQKFQTTEVIRDQIITNNLNDVRLQMYRCSDIKLVDTFQYAPVAGSPIPLPDIVQEVEIDFSQYPPDQYFFVVVTGFDDLNVAISERIQTYTKKLTKTLLFECSGSTNRPDFIWSTGIKSIVRVEGLIQKIMPETEIFEEEDEQDNQTMLHYVQSDKVTMLFGDARGIPDYLYKIIFNMIGLDNFVCEGQQWVLTKDSKINPNIYEGYPAYSFTLDVKPKSNVKFHTFKGSTGAELTGVILVVDATAFGGQAGGLTNIDLHE